MYNIQQTTIIASPWIINYKIRFNITFILNQKSYPITIVLIIFFITNLTLYHRYIYICLYVTLQLSKIFLIGSTIEQLLCIISLSKKSRLPYLKSHYEFIHLNTMLRLNCLQILVLKMWLSLDKTSLYKFF